MGPITLRIPVRLRGVPRGVLRGGVLAVQSQSIDISCLPADIPEHLEVDVSGMRLAYETTVQIAHPLLGPTVVRIEEIELGVELDDDAFVLAE